MKAMCLCSTVPKHPCGRSTAAWHAQHALISRQLQGDCKEYTIPLSMPRREVLEVFHHCCTATLPLGVATCVHACSVNAPGAVLSR
jgi:hypothetical protein